MRMTDGSELSAAALNALKDALGDEGCEQLLALAERVARVLD